MRFSGLHAMVAEMRYVWGMPLLTLDRVSIAYGHLPLLDEVALQIDARERVSIIGRNGTGKSTLLRILSD
jgi:ATP-binding cassette subfamily F protein uup